jgi:hypothetical protein
VQGLIVVTEVFSQALPPERARGALEGSRHF